MDVALLTIEQKNLLVGQLFAPDSYFGPTQDADGNWITSTQTQEFCVVEEFMWVKTLPLTTWKRPPNPSPPDSRE